MATISGIEVRNVVKVERVGLHSHIKGLGLTDNLEAHPTSGGMVGQQSARRAAGLIVKMIQVCFLDSLSRFKRHPAGILNKK